MTTIYSGRTTSYEHKHTKWQEGFGKDAKTINYEENPEYLTDGKLDWHKIPCGAKSAIQTQTIFEAQWSDCPIEVCAEVEKLWEDHEYGNDSCYFPWEMMKNEDSYPITAEYLKSKNITNCLIHYWW